MIIKIHKGPDGRRVIAVCDHDILGKKFEEGRLQLDLTSSFYKGEEKAEKDLIDEIRKGSCVLNIVGKKSIEFCRKKGFIEKPVFKIFLILHCFLLLTVKTFLHIFSTSCISDCF